MRFSGFCVAAAILAGQAAAQELACDWTAYKAQPGLNATRAAGGGVEVAWLGERGEELRATFAASGGQPVVRELAARSAQGKWIVLGRNLTPEFQVTSGKRRLSEQQMAPLRELGIAFTPEVVEREKWNAFWDAPLMVPGRTGTQHGPAAHGRRNPPRLGRFPLLRLRGDDRRGATRNRLRRRRPRHFSRAACCSPCIAAPTCCARK